MSGAGHRGIVKTPFGFTADAAAVLAGQESGSLFHTKKGQEKDGDILVYPFHPSRVKTTGRAHPGALIEFYGFGLNACNEKKHKRYPDQRARKRGTF